MSQTSAACLKRTRIIYNPRASMIATSTPLVMAETQTCKNADYIAIKPV